MDTALDHLDPHFRARVFEFLARCTEKRIPLVIANTLRTAVEQADCVQRGVSWITHSKHQDGLAIDVVPLSSYLVHGTNKLLWDVNDPVWSTLGTIGETIGFIWGGRWRRSDLGHFEQRA